MRTAKVPVRLCKGMFESECGFEIGLPDGTKLSGIARMDHAYVMVGKTQKQTEIVKTLMENGYVPGYLEVEWVEGRNVKSVENGQVLLRFILPDESYQTRSFRFPLDDLIYD